MRKTRIDEGKEFWFGVWFVICALIGLGVTGVFVWAVIRLVVHFTS